MEKYEQYPVIVMTTLNENMQITASFTRSSF